MQTIQKQFWNNVLPSMAAFAFSGLYTIVDGFFIGQNIGDSGLAAVNIAYPVAALLQAVGTGTGMAGAIWIAIKHGEKNEDSKNLFLGNTLILLILASICLTPLLLLSYGPILHLFGAQGQVFEYAASYLRIIVIGAVLQICATGLLPIIRNYGGAYAAMSAMIAGFVTNIFFDWLFTSVLKQGTAGAALATVIGQGISLIPCLVFLIRHRPLFSSAKLKLNKGTVLRILSTGISPFGATLSPMVVIVILNKGAIYYGSETAVACYAVISYVMAIVQLLLQGIGDGAQPLIGKCYGSGDRFTLKKVQRMAYATSAATAAACIILLYGARNVIPPVFGASPAVEALFHDVILYFLAGSVFLSFLRITISCCYATGRNRAAYLLIYGEPLLLTALVAFVLPRFLGLNGVWLSVSVTQGALALFCLALARFSPDAGALPDKPAWT